jgi:hypothetical protein
LRVDEVRQVPAAGDDDVDELWIRPTGEPDIRDVEAARIDDLGGWLVWAMTQEFLRQGRLGVELRQRMTSALRRVEGVTSVSEHDRQSWLVTGTPSGEMLTRAAAHVVDDLAGRFRKGLAARLRSMIRKYTE